MGTNQIFLMLLAVLIVGLGIMAALIKIQDNILNTNKEAIISDLVMLANKAHKYKLMPKSYGGGSNSYNEMEIGDLGSLAFTDNENALYHILSLSNDEVVIQAKGKKGKIGWIINCTVDNDGKTKVETIQKARFN
ncbi:MAG: hypothetical protein CSB55_05105 [Candidatus Cloacimonadota bacterium]|nr:MAG: hypothetical protein CSB55_05105 [Candidatus Cloacimonadota bacterium]